MKEERYYYSLTFRGSSKYHNSHDSKKNSQEPLTIGETPDCEVQYEQLDPNYEPEYYATILPNEDGRSWRIVKRSPHVNVNIAGVGGVSYVYNLKDGDKISFEGQSQELVFNVHADENFDGGIVDVHKNMPLRYLAIFGIIAVGLICAWQWWIHYNRQSVDNNDVKGYYSSIYRIQVDSVTIRKALRGQRDTIVVDAMHLKEKFVGTAFLTKDNQLVTARHCVEYWLGLDVPPDLEIDSLDHHDIICMVARANTYNYTHENGDTTYVIRSYCSAYSEDKKDTILFYSDDINVHINKENDDVFAIDNFIDRYYFPTITPHYANRKMEMGDILWVDVHKKGEIELADSEDMRGLNPETPLGFLGYPQNDEAAICMFASGKLVRPYVAGKLLMHSGGDLTHGNSGGPVFIKRCNKIKVVGVVSRVDRKNDALTKSIPITEIRKGGKK